MQVDMAGEANSARKAKKPVSVKDRNTGKRSQAFEKIKGGLDEALLIAKGEAKPARVSKVAKNAGNEAEKPTDSVWHPNRKRPTIYEEGILQRVCDELTEGLSIKQICEPIDMPRWQEVYLEMQRNEDVRIAIAQAREAQQEVTADDIVEMADLATPEDHNVVKLRIWARQWRAAKLAPKKYGEKQSVEVTADIGATAARVLMDLTAQAREAKAIEHSVIDVTPTLIGENTVNKNK